MALTNDSWEWHLTPTGWVLGTERRDQFTQERETPEDRVLTGCFSEKLEDAYSEIQLAWAITWQHPDVNPQRLLKKFGSRPMRLDENVESASV